MILANDRKNTVRLHKQNIGFTELYIQYCIYSTLNSSLDFQKRLNIRAPWPRPILLWTLLLAPQDARSLIFPKKTTYFEYNWLIKVTVPPKVKVVRLVHWNVFYTTHLNSYDSKSEFSTNHLFWRGRKVEISRLGSKVGSLRVVLRPGWYLRVFRTFPQSFRLKFHT